MLTKNDIIQILNKEVAPSLGVTEPGAVALACAAAAKDDREIKELKIIVSPNIYKNCMAVGIPGLKEKGIKAAAALGAVGGDYKLGLQALEKINSNDVDKCHELLAKNIIKVEISDNGEMLYIEAISKGKNKSGRCIIRGTHSNITLIESNGVVEFESSYKESSQEEISEKIMGEKISDLVKIIEDMDYKELEFLIKGAEMNEKAAEYGLREKPGMAVGDRLKKYLDKGILPDSLLTQVQIYTAAASDVRVSGCFVPVMTCAGSGNHGITAFVPVVVTAKWLKASKEKFIKALAISNLVTIYIKNYSGRLSGMCGCGVAAATGASAAITYLYGGDIEKIEGSIKNMIGDISGMICDGAKYGCSLKLSTAASCAVKAAMLSLDGAIIPGDNGIMGKTCEQSIWNLGEVSAVGMADTDKVILNVMQISNC